MRKINENNYVDFTISANGWTLTVPTFKKALRQWKNIQRPGCTLYGNKPDGTQAIIDTR